MRTRRRCSAPPRRIAACMRRTPTQAYPAQPTVSATKRGGKNKCDGVREGGKVLLHFRSGQADARATRFQKGQGGKCADSIKINPNYEQFIHLAEQPSARVRALKIFPQLCPFPPPRPSSSAFALPCAFSTFITTPSGCAALAKGCVRLMPN